MSSRSSHRLQTKKRKHYFECEDDSDSDASPKRAKLETDSEEETEYEEDSDAEQYYSDSDDTSPKRATLQTQKCHVKEKLPKIVSQYEQDRNRTMGENAEFLRSIGMIQAKKNFRACLDNGRSGSNTKIEKKPWQKKDYKIGKRRISSRLRKEPAPITVLSSFKPIKLKPRKAPTLEMVDNASDDQRKQEMEEFLFKMKHFQPLLNNSATRKRQQSLDSFIEDMEELTENEDLLILKQEISALCIHPMEEEIMVAAGDLKGNVGIRLKSHNEGKTYNFGPHVNLIRCIKFNPKMPSQLYSCSFDGSMRRGDMETGTFHEIFQTPLEKETQLYEFDWLSVNEIVVSTIHGDIAIIDSRTKSTTAEKVYTVHKRPVRGVSVHPTNKQYICTASADCLVSVWDIRKMTATDPESIRNLYHRDVVNSAYFSPITGNYLLTKSQHCDTGIRLYDTSNSMSNISELLTIPSTNEAAENFCLNKFQATWHPTREDIVVSGSRGRHAMIDLLNARTGDCVQQYHAPLATRGLPTAVHPFKNIIVRGGRGGRMHVYM